MDKLSLQQVKALPPCEAYLFTDEFGNASVRFRPSSGNGNKCAISADAPISNFDSIRREISKLGDSDPVDFVGANVYAYGSLSKNGVGIFSGKNISSIDNPDGFDTSNVTKMSYLFKNSSLTNLNFLSKWDVSNVTNMQSMFEGCTGLSDISGLKNWNVGKVTNMSNMFKGKGTKGDGEVVYGSDNLTDISGLSNWATKVGNVTNMSGMFEGRTSLKSLKGLENWDISNVTNMSGMFSQCASDPDFVSEVKKNSNEKGFDISALSSWVKKAGKNSAARNVNKVTDMSNMFEGCTSLKSLAALKDWDVSKVTNMEGMFASVIKNQDKRDALIPVEGYAGEMLIASVEPLNSWKVGSVNSMNRMFEGCSEIKNFDGLKGWDTKSVLSMIGTFEDCKSISSLNFLEKWNVNNVTDMNVMFALCDKIKNTDGLQKWNVSNVTKMDGMFAYCSSLSNIKELANWNANGKSSTSKLTSTYRMFYQCSSLASLDPLSSWNVGSVKDMHEMFNNCGSLTSLQPLSSWNVGKVEKMSSMFSSCTGLTSLSDLEKWNVGSVTDMSSMFSGCNHLNKLDGLGKWNVNKVENMSSMFSGCYEYDVDESGHVTNEKGLADITALSGWATKLGSVTDMSGMFTGCGLLKSLSNLKEWNVSSVENMSNMFSSCTGLTSLSDLEKWNVGNVTNMSSMFSGCTNLGNLNGLQKWNVGNVTDMSSMFSDCKKLTGDADLSNWTINNVGKLDSMFSNAGAESSDNFVLDFSNKTFTKPTDPNSHFSVDGMFSGFKGTLIANKWQSQGFNNSDPDSPDPDDPIKSHFAKGDIFSLDENNHSDNIVITNNGAILTAISEDETPLKKIAYYIPVKAKLMEPGDMPSCKCDDSSVPGGTTGGTTGDTAGGTTYTYNVPALYNSSNLEKKQDEKSQDYAYRVVKNSFASKFRSAIDSQSGKGAGEGTEEGEEEGTEEGEEEGTEEGEEEGTGEGADDTGEDTGDSRSAKLKLRVKKLRSIKKSRSVRDDEGEGEEVSEDPESSEEKQGNTYKIMFKKSSGNTCTWTELGNGDDNVPVSEPKSPLTFFNTLYYLETFVKPVPLPHTGGQSAVMFTFLSIGLFSMFAVAGAFARRPA